MLAAFELVAQLFERSVTLGDDVVAVDRLQVLLPGHHEGIGVQVGELAADSADHFPHAVFDEARLRVGLLDHRQLVGTLHQLVYLRAHRLLDDLQQPAGVDVELAILGTADVEGSDAALVMGGDRDRLDHPLDLLGVEALLGEAIAGRSGDHLLGAGAGGHSLGLDAGQAPGTAVGRDGSTEEGVDLLRGVPGDRRGDGLRIACRDRDLRPHPCLALANALGDMRRQRLRPQRGFAEHDGVDRLADDLLEPRHVDAGLLWVEVDEALQLGEVELGGAVCLHLDHLLDPGDADPGQADSRFRPRGLDVYFHMSWGGRFSHRLMKGRQTDQRAAPGARRTVGPRSARIEEMRCKLWRNLGGSAILPEPTPQWSGLHRGR